MVQYGYVNTGMFGNGFLETKNVRTKTYNYQSSVSKTLLSVQIEQSLSHIKLILKFRRQEYRKKTFGVYDST